MPKIITIPTHHCSPSLDYSVEESIVRDYDLHSLLNDPATYRDRAVSKTEKVNLLKNKWVPPHDFIFPSKGRTRKYNQAWGKDYAWLRYSVSTDAVFCSYCLLFGNWLQGSGVHPNVFQSTGFRNWKNAKGEKHGALPAHEASEAHKIAATKALAFLEIEAGRAKDIQCCLSKAHEDEIKKNRAILLSIIDVIIILGQRNIPFHGHGWDN